MAKIKAFEISPELAERLKEQIAEIPNEFVSAYGKECLRGGFTKPGAIRERLRALVEGGSPLPGSLVAFFADCTRHRALVRMLSESGMGMMFDWYSAILNREDLLIALLVDPREEVHRLGVEFAGKAMPAASEADQAAARNLISHFVTENLLEPVRPWSEASGAPDFEEMEAIEPPALAEIPEIPEFSEPVRAMLESELRKQLIEQDKRIVELEREVSKRKRKVEELHEKSARERERLVGERDAARRELAQGSGEMERLRAAHEALRAEFEARLRERLAEETSAITRKWLEDCAPTEPAESPGAAEDLLVRAGNLLDEQAKQDRHSGNRKTLQERLGALEDARRRILEALSTAINPLTALRQFLPEVESEIGTIRRRLSEPSVEGDLSAHFLAFINTAETWDDLRWYSDLLEGLAGRNLLAPHASRAMADSLHRRISVLEDRFRERAPEVDTGWSLRGRLHRNEPTELLVDGHNVLFGLSEVFGHSFDDGVPRKKAREALAASVAALAANRGNLHARIYFDGAETNSVRLAENVWIEYSGGTGEHRADGCISRRLQMNDAAADQKSFVVSDDREVRREALHASGKFVPVNVFAVLLQDFGCLRGSDEFGC